MWISEIKLYNFRPFYSNKIISFHEDSQNKYTIIEAKSDTGKTTLLSALCWCLYGKDLGEYKSNKNKNNNLEIKQFNIQKKDELNEGDTDDLRVEITLNNDNEKNPRYTIIREIECRKKKDKMIHHSEMGLKIIVWENNEPNIIKDNTLCQSTINKILPEDIHMFFLFEGEKLFKNFSFTTPDNIKSAIEKISQIHLVKNAIKHMQDVRDKVYTNSNNGNDISGDIKELNKGIENLQSKIDGCDIKLKEYENERTKSQNRIDEISNIIVDIANIPSITQWSNNRKSLKDAEIDLKNKKKELEESLTKHILENSPMLICKFPINNLLDSIRTVSKHDGLPPKIRNIYLNELLEKKVCICGRCLDKEKNEESKKAADLLEHSLKQNDFSDQVEEIIEGKYVLNDILISSKEIFDNDLPNLCNEIKKLEVTLNSNDAKIEDYDKKLKEFNYEKINQLVNERKLLEIALPKQLRSIDRMKSEIDELTDKQKENRKMIDKLAVKSTNYNIKKKEADFIDKAKFYLEKINEEILEEVRKKVENRTFELFLNLHWDKVNYKKFTIDSDYYLSLKDSNDNEKISDIGTGSRQVLLLSFISALANVSGFKFPVFLDTPLANTDNEQRENIAKIFHNFMKGIQVILLVKDQEYTPRFRSIIEDNVSQELRLIKTKGKTEVKPWA